MVMSSILMRLSGPHHRRVGHTWDRMSSLIEPIGIAAGDSGRACLGRDGL